MCFWIRPNHEFERGCAVLAEHVVFFVSLYILEKIVLGLVLKRVDTIGKECWERILNPWYFVMWGLSGINSWSTHFSHVRE